MAERLRKKVFRCDYRLSEREIQELYEESSDDPDIDETSFPEIPLRELISGETVSVNERALGELLYTACERGLTHFDSIEFEDALLIYRIVSASKKIKDEESLKKYSM